MAGVVLLYMACCAFGVLEVHYSTDTWIGLSAGRQIMTEPTFPKADTFSYTSYGQTWFNQNWLSHVFFWELYNKLGSDAEVIGTWLVSAGTFTLVLLATWFRCRSWLAAFVAASIVAIACRDWLSIRPATIQFFLVAAAWLSLCALMAQGERRRWWPMALLVATYTVWPHAHGSFLFGFGLLGLFIGCAALAILLRGVLPVRRRGWWVGGARLSALLLAVTVLAIVLRYSLADLWYRLLPPWFSAISPGQQIACVLAECVALLLLLALMSPARPAISLAQGAVLVAIGLLTAALGVLLSPYGLENYIHPFKVVESDVFRTVGEWVPPYRSARFPGALRFWLALAVATATALGFLIARLIHAARPAKAPGKAWPSAADGTLWYASSSAGEADQPDKGSPRAALPLPGFNSILFDVAAVAIGLYMAMFARRFAPVFYILATPALVTWIMRLAEPLSPGIKRHGRLVVILGAWVAAPVAGVVTFRLAYSELVTEAVGDGQFDLLDRVTHNDRTPLAAIDFLRRNNLTPNVMTEWKVAAAIMFYVPGARVFIDGRAQQVYTEEQYKTYMGLLNVSSTQGPLATRVLDQQQTDLLLLPKWEVTRQLIDVIETQPQWVLVMEEPAAAIWVREGSKLLADILGRERAGTLWWPNTPDTQWRHGMLLVSTWPEELPRAVALWQAAVAGRPAFGLRAYGPIVEGLLQRGRADDAATYLQLEREKLEQLRKELPSDLHVRLLEEINRCTGLLRARTTSQGDDSPAPSP